MESDAQGAVLLSLIVPVYNVALTIEACLASALSQLPLDCEIICVDDGATDDSMARIDRVAQRHPEAASRIRYRAQANQGLSGARNAGIAAARGRYIGLLDSDDLLRDGYFERIRSVITRYPDVSIICFNAERFGHDVTGREWRSALPVHAGAADILPGNSADFDVLATNFARGRWFAWARVYDRRLFDDRQFTLGFKYQDMLLLPELYRRARRIVNIDDVLIDYRIHAKSVTARPNKSTLDNLDAIIAYYGTPAGGPASSLDALRHLVVIAALESVFHAARRMYGSLAARRALQSRQKRLGRVYLGQQLLRHGRRMSHRGVLLQAAPLTFLGAGRLRRAVRRVGRVAP